MLLGNADNNCDGVSSPAPSHCGELVGNLSEMFAPAHLLCLWGRESIAPPWPPWSTGRARLSDTTAIGRASQWHKYHL